MKVDDSSGAALLELSTAKLCDAGHASTAIGVSRRSTLSTSTTTASSPSRPATADVSPRGVSPRSVAPVSESSCRRRAR